MTAIALVVVLLYWIGDCHAGWILISKQQATTTVSNNRRRHRPWWYSNGAFAPPAITTPLDTFPTFASVTSASFPKPSVLDGSSPLPLSLAPQAPSSLSNIMTTPANVRSVLEASQVARQDQSFALSAVTASTISPPTVAIGPTTTLVQDGHANRKKVTLGTIINRNGRNGKTKKAGINAVRTVATSSTAVTTPTTRSKEPVTSHSPPLMGTRSIARQKKIVVSHIEELRYWILDQGMALKDLQVVLPPRRIPEVSTATTTTPTSLSTSALPDESLEDLQQLQQHVVVQLMLQRFREQSKPGHRPAHDNAKLALSLEGGGMRGAVTAGMAAALFSLGLSDTVDIVYGSSAGSVVGAYWVSRQMYTDVYVDILPAAQRRFVCVRRILTALVANAVDCWIQQHHPTSQQQLQQQQQPTQQPQRAHQVQNQTTATAAPTFSQHMEHGMNISFVLDGIMDQNFGLRPLDMHTFLQNDRLQPLRVVSTVLDSNHEIRSHCFGTSDFHGPQAAQRTDQRRQGLAACLEASMTVPGAAGPPVPLYLYHTKHSSEGIANQTASSAAELWNCFDALGCEPLPYRSAVEEGATHVLMLCSRPAAFVPKTAPGLYEHTVTPLYFQSHGMPEVGEYFANGGQQYIYAEDMLFLEQAKQQGLDPENPQVRVPPPRVLYGVSPMPADAQRLASERDTAWREASILPLQVPANTPELPTLEQDPQAVLNAVRSGFATVFDVFAPAMNVTHYLNFNNQHMTGLQVATLMFPDPPQSMQVDDEARWSSRFLSSIATAQTHKFHQRQQQQRRREQILQRQLRVPAHLIQPSTGRHASPSLTRRDQPQTRSSGQQARPVLDKYSSKQPVYHSGALYLSTDDTGGIGAVSAIDAAAAQQLLSILPGLRAGQMPCVSRSLRKLSTTNSF